MRTRLLICSVVVAVVGLLAAALIYVKAGDDSESDENFQFIIVDGKTYRIPLADTKMYRRELQRFGGDAAVVFDEISRWVAGLWRGKSLGITIAWISVFVSLALFLLARKVPSDASPDDGGDHEPG
jgi:hypothetical protein